MTTITEDKIIRGPLIDEKKDIPSIPCHEFIFRDIEKVLKETGDYMCMELVDTGKSLLLSEVKKNSTSIASALTRRGFKKGDVICSYIYNHLELATVVLGTWICGGCITMVIPYERAEDLKLRLEDSNARWLLVEPDTIEKARKAISSLPGGAAAWKGRLFIVGGDDPEPEAIPSAEPIQNLLNDDGKGCPTEVDVNLKDDVIYLPYSSGSTGRSKGVMHTNYTMLYTFLAYGESHNEIPTSSEGRIKLLMTNGMYHASAILFTFIYMAQGKWLGTFNKPGNSDSILFSAIDKHKPNILSVLPQQMNMLSVADFGGNDMSSLQFIFTGGAQNSPVVLQQISDRLKNKALTNSCYGTTETLGVVKFPLTKPLSATSSKGNTGSVVGELIPGAQAKILDLETGAHLGPRQEGEIAFTAPSLTKGYLNRPEATAEALKNGWYHTGDLGFYDEDGCVYFLERIKELLKYMNIQISPSELEAILNDHVEVKDAVVVGIPDDKFGDLPRAYVCLKEGAKVTAEELQKLVDGQVADYKRLRGGVAIIDEIPRNQAGKPIRKQLVDMALKGK